MQLVLQSYKGIIARFSKGNIPEYGAGKVWANAGSLTRVSSMSGVQC